MKFFLETKLAMKKKWKILKNIIYKKIMHFFVVPMLPKKNLKVFCSFFKNKTLIEMT